MGYIFVKCADIYVYDGENIFRFVDMKVQDVPAAFRKLFVGRKLRFTFKRIL